MMLSLPPLARLIFNIFLPQAHACGYMLLPLSRLFQANFEFVQKIQSRIELILHKAPAIVKAAYAAKAYSHRREPVVS
jgi:hypothetical protein